MLNPAGAVACSACTPHACAYACAWSRRLGHDITIHYKLQPGKQSTVHTTGREVLAHVGYELNCTRIAGMEDAACWYDLAVPLGSVAFFVALSALLLAFCVKDPH